MSRRRASCRPPHSRLRRAALTVRLVAGGHHDDLLFCWETMYHVMVHSCGMKGNKMNIKTVGKSGQISLGKALAGMDRSEEHTSELQSLMRISYAVFCLKKKKKQI